MRYEPEMYVGHVPHCHLQSLCTRYGSVLSVDQVSSTTKEASQLIADADLSLAAQALKTLAGLLRSQPAAGQAAAAEVCVRQDVILTTHARLTTSQDSNISHYVWMCPTKLCEL